ncbi:efflux RND transporter periplasmic adaptor subunit [Undibacterium squillarum]|uniref:efflux RND transporter periplasmic adaptor subunit n=1 Tax=Undibacterium squillarum TaxID=1131567 RepID=UPI0035AE95E1
MMQFAKMFRVVLPGLLAAACSVSVMAAEAAAPALKTVQARSTGAAGQAQADAVVEAVRQTQISAQVAGAITEILVRPGDSVKAGQVLVRLDARAAQQQANASQAQAEAANASLAVAEKDWQRSQQLAAQHFISAAQLDKARAQYLAAAAETRAQIAAAGAVRTQSGFYTLTAPYSGVVSDVPAMPGDMAMPGKPLLTMYEPGALRVTAMIPEQQAARLRKDGALQVSWQQSGVQPATLNLTQFTVLPAADPASHSIQIRAALPNTVQGLRPGMFARLSLSLDNGNAQSTPARILVPRSAVIRRAELSAVYVVQGSKILLRQVRTGQVQGEEIEILSGVNAGELLAAEPQQAARLSSGGKP